MPGRKPLSSSGPLLYGLSVFVRRMVRRLRWSFGNERWALCGSIDPLPELVVAHRSILIRKLEGTDLRLQSNKTASLGIAAPLVDGTILEPGETFSFWRLVGRPTAGGGFPPGLQLSFGRMVAMTGGGLCQMSNLLHWMVLHTPLEVTERHRHSFDPFPDYRRTVPFGTGATVFYNYLDLCFRNGTEQRFQVRVGLDDEYLTGEIRCEAPLPEVCRIEERDHRFVRRKGVVYRENRLWRVRMDPKTSRTIDETLIMENCVAVSYDADAVPGLKVEEED